MGIEEFLEKDTSFKPQLRQKSTGFLDGIINGAILLSNIEKNKELKFRI